MPNKGSEMLLLHNQHMGGGASEGATHITTGGRHNFTEHKQTHTHRHCVLTDLFPPKPAFRQFINAILKVLFDFCTNACVLLLPYTHTRIHLFTFVVFIQPLTSVTLLRSSHATTTL